MRRWQRLPAKEYRSSHWPVCWHRWPYKVIKYSAERKTFDLEARGEELLALPNVTIRVFPLVNSTLHELGEQSDPEWLLRVRHKTGLWNMQTRPSVTIQPCNGLNIYFKFRLPARPLMKEPHEVWTGLHNHSLELVHLAVNGHVREDFELDCLRRINDLRGERLRNLLSTDELPPIQTGLDVSALPTRKLVAA